MKTIMKKEYMIPATEVAKVGADTIMVQIGVEKGSAQPTIFTGE